MPALEFQSALGLKADYSLYQYKVTGVLRYFGRLRQSTTSDIANDYLLSQPTVADIPGGISLLQKHRRVCLNAQWNAVTSVVLAKSHQDKST